MEERRVKVREDSTRMRRVNKFKGCKRENKEGREGKVSEVGSAGAIECHQLPTSQQSLSIQDDKEGSQE